MSGQPPSMVPESINIYIKAVRRCSVFLLKAEIHVNSGIFFNSACPEGKYLAGLQNQRFYPVEKETKMKNGLKR
jgi:hypothetical protein